MVEVVDVVVVDVVEVVVAVVDVVEVVVEVDVVVDTVCATAASDPPTRNSSITTAGAATNRGLKPNRGSSPSCIPAPSNRVIPSIPDTWFKYCGVTCRKPPAGLNIFKINTVSGECDG